RRQVADVICCDADAVADALAELVLDHEKVPDHALLHRAFTLLQRRDEVVDQVVLLPLLGEDVALAGLDVVVRAWEWRPRQAAGDDRAVLEVGWGRGFL